MDKLLLIHAFFEFFRLVSGKNDSDNRKDDLCFSYACIDLAKASLGL